MIAFSFDVKAYEAINHHPLKRHIDDFEKILYGTNSEMFVITEIDDWVYCTSLPNTLSSSECILIIRYKRR
jgi:hypothetical protein